MVGVDRSVELLRVARAALPAAAGGGRGSRIHVAVRVRPENDADRHAAACERNMKHPGKNGAVGRAIRRHANSSH